MVDTFEKWGNPFNEDSQDFGALDSKEVIGDKTVGSLRDMETIGQSQYEKYIDERLKQRSTPISNIIRRNNVSPFKKTSQPNDPEPLMKSDLSVVTAYIQSVKKRRYGWVLPPWKLGSCPDSFRHGRCKTLHKIRSHGLRWTPYYCTTEWHAWSWRKIVNGSVV